MENRVKLSAIILTKNNAKIIAKCLESVKFCDEVMVIDDNSQDNTVSLAKKVGAKIYKRSLNENFSEQRNFGLKKASYEWVLFVDADEAVSPKLALEIQNAVKNGQFNGYFLERQDFIWGRRLKHGETGSIKLLRLGKKTSGVWKRKVHEVWNIKGNVGVLKNPILHSPHPTLNEFINHINWMSSLHAQANLIEGKRSSMSKVIFLPFFKFFYNFIIRLGFLDGMQGFVSSFIMSLHSYLAWSKLWFYQKRTK